MFYQTNQETGHIELFRLAERSRHESWNNLKKFVREGKRIARDPRSLSTGEKNDRSAPSTGAEQSGLDRIRTGGKQIKSLSS